MLALLRLSYAPTPLGARTGIAGCSLMMVVLSSRVPEELALFGDSIKP
jgi:hypothetical protein